MKIKWQLENRILAGIIFVSFVNSCLAVKHMWSLEVAGYTTMSYECHF